jgi:hypothetical protein
LTPIKATAVVVVTALLGTGSYTILFCFIPAQDTTYPGVVGGADKTSVLAAVKNIGPRATIIGHVAHAIVSPVVIRRTCFLRAARHGEAHYVEERKPFYCLPLFPDVRVGIFHPSGEYYLAMDFINLHHCVLQPGWTSARSRI